MTETGGVWVKVISVLLAEHEMVVRQGIRRILELDAEIEIIAEAADAAGAEREAAQLKPDVALIAAGLPEGGAVAAARIKQVAADTRVLILAWEAEQAGVRWGAAQGLYEILAKNCSDVELVMAVKELANQPVAGQRGSTGAEVQGAGERLQPRHGDYNLDLLTAREREVLLLISEGKTNKEIGAALGISANTADSHRKHIMEKLGIHSKTELVRFALVKGLLRQ